jgi:outer membrane receptor protein involved in Fe transport
MRIARNWLIMIGIVVATMAAAQENFFGTVKGIVVEQATHQPVPYANVALRKAGDSTIVTGQVTDSLGRFTLTGVPAGEYYLTPQSIGFKPKKSALLRLNPEHPLVDVGALRLESASIPMQEVDVSAEKLLYSTSVDRKIYNVDRDLVSKAGSVSDLLHNVPSVQVDIDGTVSLRGSSNVLFMVNGRSSPLINHQGATVLDQMPANTIERIEVITNPSAEYKPDAAAGIINIVLKKNTAQGVNGSVSGNAGNSERYNSNINLNYNPGSGNMYATYAIRRNNRNRSSTDNRRQSDTTFAFYDQAVSSHGRPLSHSLSFGGDYRLNKQHQFGVSGSYFYVGQDRGEANKNRFYDRNQALTQSYVRNRAVDMNYQETELTAYYERSFAKEDHTLRFEFTVSRAPEVEDNRFANVYLYPAAPNSFDKSLLKNSDNSNEINVEYTNPLSDKSSLKAGYTADFNNSDGDFRVDNFDTLRQAYVMDTTKTNRFRRDETIHALFATYKRKIGRLGVLAGLRGEYSAITSDLVTLDSTLTQSYTNLYPSLHLSYGMSKATELQLSYSKRVRRPESDDLNPFPEYVDPHNIRAGNPNLRPEYIHSLELGCQYQNGGVTLVPAMFYRYTYNRFTWVVQALSDTVFLTTHDNLSSDQAGGLELNLSLSSSKLYSLHGNASVFRNQIDASNLTGGRQTVSSWSSDLTLDLNLTSTTRMQLNSNYRSAMLTAQGRFDPRYILNGGFRQEFYGGKVVFLATASDIFHTMKRSGVLNTGTVYETTSWSMDSRVLYAGFTFRFGSQPKKSRDDQIHYDDAGGGQ